MIGVPATQIFKSRNLLKNDIAILGTSIEAQTFLTGYYNAQGAMNIANAILGAPFDNIVNYGVSGDTSGPQGANPGMTSRVQSIIASGVAWCYVGFPINDVQNGAGIDVVNFTIPNMINIYNQLIYAGINVIACNGGPTTSLSIGTYKKRYFQIQKAIKDYVSTNNNIVICNSSNALTDITTGLPFTIPASTRDGIHDNYQGAALKAQVLVDAIKNQVKPQDKSFSGIYDPNNYSINPYAQGDNVSGTNGFTAAAGITGTGPNGWGSLVRATGAAVGSRAAARASVYKQPKQGARLAVTATATWDGAGFYFGGSQPQAIGRYDQTWVASQAYTYGKRVKPTISNGYIYTLVVPGTTAAADVTNTWSTVEGDLVVDNGVTWLCQKIPSTGDQFYAEVEVETSGLTANKGANVSIRLATWDTLGSIKEQTFGLFTDVSGSLGLPSQILPPSMTIRTPIITISSGYTLRYLEAYVAAYGEAFASFNVDVFKASIIKVN